MNEKTMQFIGKALFSNVSEIEYLREEIKRLNNIINELEKEIIKEKERTYYERDAYRFTAYEHILDKLQELKGDE